MKDLLRTGKIRIESWLSEAEERCLANDVLDGLTRPFKELPPKHFYDERGSELFEQICELPEYYPTRTEMAILRARATDIIDVNAAGELVELGSGAADKARVLLDAMDGAGTLRRYVPLDVSGSVVQGAARQLVEEYPGLRIHGVIGDFERHLDRVPESGGVPRLVALLGGTIGNFPPGTRRGLLRSIGSLLGPEDRLLLGTDLVKDPAVIEAAYDDSQGITAAFNRNVLHVVNRELDADFSPEEFEHIAFFDRRHEWVEMRLRARRPCSVLVGELDLRVEFAAGEELRTEISAKFTRTRLEADLAAAGLALDRWYSDPDELFALSLATRAAQNSDGGRHRRLRTPGRADHPAKPDAADTPDAADAADAADTGHTAGAADVPQPRDDTAAPDHAGAQQHGRTPDDPRAGDGTRASDDAGARDRPRASDDAAARDRPRAPDDAGARDRPRAAHDAQAREFLDARALARRGVGVRAFAARRTDAVQWHAWTVTQMAPPRQ